MYSFRKVTAITIATVMMVGCSSSSSTPASPTPTSEPTEKPVVIALNSNLMTMDSSIQNDTASGTIIETCMAGLVQTGQDGTIQPDIAESWEVSEDGMTYTFHINPNANWSNGEPVTAHDFVYAWRRLADPATAADFSYFLDNIHMVNAAEVSSGELPLEELGVEAIDDKTLVAHLSLPCGFFLNTVSGATFYPLNQAFVESRGDAYGHSVDDLLYDGAYIMTGWDEGSAYTFSKNENYVHADDVHNETIIFRIVLEAQTAVLEYEQNNINAVALNGEMVDRYADNEGLHRELSGVIWYLQPMVKDPMMSNKDLREAVAYAVDREAITGQILKDGSVPAKGIVSEQYFTGPTGSDYRDDAGTLTEYNPEKAKAAYEKAKEALGDNISIELYYEDSDSAKAVAENVQMMLKTNLEGIEVTMNCKPKKTRIQDLLSHNFCLMLTRWGPSDTSPQTFLDLWTTEHSINAGDYSNEAYDSLVFSADKGEDAMDPAKAWQDYIDAEHMLINEDWTAVPLYQEGSALLITPGVKGVIFGKCDNKYRYAHWE